MHRISALVPVLVVVTAACGFHAPGGSGGGGGDDDGGGGGGADARPGTDSGVSPGAWWNPAWSSRMRIAINTSVALPAGFQLGVPRDLDVAPCDGPRDAVRVVRNHTAELPRVIDELGSGVSDEWIWFRLPASVAAGTGPSEYWLYCGNASPGAPPSSTDVFDLYDGFDGNSLSGLWNAQGTQVTVMGGAVTLGGTGNTIHSKTSYGAGTATDFVLQAAGSAVSSPWFWGGFEVQFSVTAPWVIWHARNANQVRQEILRSGSNASFANERALDTGAHLYGVEHYGTSAGFRYNNAPVGTISYGGNIGLMNVRLHNYQSGGTIQILMARVRRAVYPVPTATLEAVETQP
ncbi:MAG TPA: DUF2341 domain-containing protein [Kofleriaceae bacterium]|nr:DUF2341 domain-containing protein [Kofleriaceae bacterium]